MINEETYQLIRMTVGDNVRRFRIENNQNQESFACMTGLSRPYVSKIEHGKANPSTRVLVRIADGMGRPVASLFTNADNQPL